MKEYNLIILLLFLILPLRFIGQENNECEQLIKAYEYVEINFLEKEFKKIDTTIKNKIYRENRENLLRIDSIYSIDCIKTVNYKRPNLRLSFTRINDKSISIWINRIKKNPKKHSSGKYLIFIFNDINQIVKIFETGWTE